MTDRIAVYRQLATYNKLANERLYAACGRLPDSERKKTRRAFFKSIHRTLNHILLGDRIWLARFASEEVPSTDLDAIIYEDFDDLRYARTEDDIRIEKFSQSLTDEFLEGTIRYVNNEGRMFDDSVAMLVTHFFNHQTHHRGQVHDLLSQTAVAPPVLDLHRVIKPDPDT